MGGGFFKGMKPKYLAIIVLAVIAAVVSTVYFKLETKAPAGSLAVKTQTDKVYSVKEIVNLLNTNPESLKGKLVQIKAYHVSAVGGLYCHDYMELTDPEYVDLFKSMYASGITQAQADAIAKRVKAEVPILLTGQTLAMPQGIFPTTYGIYQGHFYDTWATKTCEKGNQRFVIENKIQELGVKQEASGLIVPDRVNLYLLMENGSPYLELSAVAAADGCSQASGLKTNEASSTSSLNVEILGYTATSSLSDGSGCSAVVVESKKQIPLDLKWQVGEKKEIVFKLQNKTNIYNLLVSNNILSLLPISAPNVVTTRFAENPTDTAIELRLNVSANSSLPAPLVDVVKYGGECPSGGCGSKTTFYNNGDVRIEAPVYDRASGGYVTKTTESQITLTQLNDLVTKINNQDFERVKQRPFTGTCPTAYDGQAVTYIVYKNGTTENLDSCRYILDQPLFETISQLSAEVQ